jgi:hypothetical protein
MLRKVQIRDLPGGLSAKKLGRFLVHGLIRMPQQYEEPAPLQKRMIQCTSVVTVEEMKVADGGRPRRIEVLSECRMGWIPEAFSAMGQRRET